MATILILTGVPGSGKTTVIEAVIKAYPELAVANYGDMILQEASYQNIDRDTLRKMPISEQQRIGLKVAKRIRELPHKLILVDTHACVKTPLGYFPGLPEEVLRTLQPKAVAMIECPPSVIFQRRQNDKSRKRDNESLESIEYHQQISRSFLIACATIAGAVYVPIHNHGHPLEAAKQLLAVVEAYKSK